jgi:hypothetical protein
MTRGTKKGNNHAPGCTCGFCARRYRYAHFNLFQQQAAVARGVCGTLGDFFYAHPVLGVLALLVLLSYGNAFLVAASDYTRRTLDGTQELRTGTSDLVTTNIPRFVQNADKALSMLAGAS